MLKNRKYLAESFAAFKNSKKKEDPFAKDEKDEDEDDVETTDEDTDETESDEDKDDATEEEIEESEEDDEMEAEMEDALEADDASHELEDLDGDGDVDGDDAEIADEEAEDDGEEGDDEQPAAGIAITATFGAGGGNDGGNTDIASMLSGGMNAMNGMTSFKRPEWAITRVMTDNGERVAMEYQNETECEVIVGNLTYTEADARSTEIANQLNLAVFNSETDKYLGRVSNKVVRKQDSEKKTSYKY